MVTRVDEKSLFSGALIGPKSLFCCTLIACNFEICAARCCNKKQQKTLRARSSTRAFRYRALAQSSMSSNPRQPRNRRHISTVEEEAAPARTYKIVHQNVYKHSSNSSTATTTRHHHDYHPPGSKEHNCLVEGVRVCRPPVVAAAAACCSYRDNEHPPPPNGARAIGREGRRAVSAQLAGRVVRTCTKYYLLGALVGAFCE